MAVKPVPDGYSSVTPYLIVQGAAKLIEFMKRAFAAQEKMPPMTDPGGAVGHAEMRIGDSVVMLADATREFPPMAALLHLYVNDADAVFRNAVEAGAAVVREPATQFYGDRSATVKDPWGNLWSIATHVEDVPHDELMRRVAAMQQKS